MTDRPNDILLLAGKILTIIMQIGLVIGGAVLTLVTPLILIFYDRINAKILSEVGDAASSLPLFNLIGLIAFALAMICLAFVFFGKLRAIIASVGEGDPFIPENAERLNLMAWLMLGVQLLMIPLAGFGLALAKWADEVEHGEITIDAGIDLTGILIIVILFILARVFKHGAAMREDLEGTV